MRTYEFPDEIFVGSSERIQSLELLHGLAKQVAQVGPSGVKPSGSVLSLLGQSPDGAGPPRRGRAARLGTDVMGGTELPDRGRWPLRQRADPLLQEHSKHPHEAWMGADGPASNHLDAKLFAKGLRLHVQVVENFEVIGQKADGVDQDASGISPLQDSHVFEDIGAKPRVFRTAAPALEHGSPAPRAIPAVSATRRHVSWICCA